MFNHYGLAYCNIGHYDLAGDYLQKTVDIYTFLNMEANLALSLLDLGDINRKMKMYKTAYLNYQQSLCINQKKYGSDDYITLKLMKQIEEVYSHLED